MDVETIYKLAYDNFVFSNMKSTRLYGDAPMGV
jgi:hypothetical protein